MKYLFTLILLFSGQFIVAQEVMLRVQDIEQNESKLLKTIEKFQTKPNRERLKKDFIIAYEEFHSGYVNQLNISLKSEVFGKQNWEGILNKMVVLQFIGNKVKASPATAFVNTHDYAVSIDSIKNLAAKSLYEDGKNALEKNKQYEIAYRDLKRASNIMPDYLNTNQLLKQILISGTRNVFIAPVINTNSGNVIEFGKSNSSMGSNFIIHSIIDDLSPGNAGAVLQAKDEQAADWIVKMKWVALDMSAERVNKYTQERSTKIKENEKEITVTATIDFVERSKNATGTLNCVIFDKKNKNDVFNKNFVGTIYLQKKEATYKGDRRALTFVDNEVINNSKNFNYSSESTTKLYKERIHHQLLGSIGPYLNWNYQQ